MAPDSPIRLLFVIGVPRTGTTRAMGLLRAFGDLAVHGEVFNVNTAYGLDDSHDRLCERAGIESNGIRDPAFTLWVRNHPREVLDFLYQAAGGRVVVIKLFPHHLATAQVATLLARRDVAAVFVTRRPIDCYISEAKARAVGQWNSIDTTDVLIDGHVGRFTDWFSDYRGWYRFCRSCVANTARPTADIRYENELNLPDAEAVAALGRTLASLGIDPGLTEPGKVSVLHRQDRASDYAAKMANWEAFRAELMRTHLAEAAFSDTAFM